VQSPGLHRTDRVLHRLHRAGVGFIVLRKQVRLPPEPAGDHRELGQDRAVVALESRNLSFRADAGKRRLILSAFAQIDEFELVRLADFLEQHVDADRADAGGVKELHLGFLAWLKGSDDQGRFSMSDPNGEG